MATAVNDDQTLCTVVQVSHPESGERYVFGRGERPPDWAVKLITNPTVWGDANGDQLDGADDPPATGPGEAFVSFMSDDTFQEVTMPKKASRTAKKSRR